MWFIIIKLSVQNFKMPFLSVRSDTFIALMFLFLSSNFNILFKVNRERYFNAGWWMSEICFDM